MSAEQKLRDLATRLEAAQKIAAEKRHHFHACRRLVDTPGRYQTYLVAAAGYASAADDVEELSDLFVDAQAEAQAEMLRREAEPKYVDGNLSVDQEMSLRASQGEEDAMRWVAQNLK